MISDKKLVFPQVDIPVQEIPVGSCKDNQRGLDVRTFFAGQFMAAMLINSSIDILKPSEYAADAVLYADALIDQLNRPKV